MYKDIYQIKDTIITVDTESTYLKLPTHLKQNCLFTSTMVQETISDKIVVPQQA